VNVTEPGGVPPPLVTVAVNVTGWPTSLGFFDDASAVVVLERLMVWVNTEDVEPLLLESPP
jgi:hypothetical protein